MSLRPFFGAFPLVALSGMAHAAPSFQESAGANPAAIQASVDAFRTLLGTSNGNASGPLAAGRREINWDGAANLDPFASPNLMPGNFFNATVARGAAFTSPDGNGVIVSQRTVAPVNGLARFGNIDPSYTATFQTFSAERLFAPSGGVITDTTFFVPGTNTPATVSAFASVFADVDIAGLTRIDLFDLGDNLIVSRAVQPANGGLSFLGISFNDGTRIARVRITTGNTPLAAGFAEAAPGLGSAIDVVAMDDFLFSEPQAVPAPASIVLALTGFAALKRRSR